MGDFSRLSYNETYQKVTRLFAFSVGTARGCAVGCIFRVKCGTSFFVVLADESIADFNFGVVDIPSADEFFGSDFVVIAVLRACDIGGVGTRDTGEITAIESSRRGCG